MIHNIHVFNKKCLIKKDRPSAGLTAELHDSLIVAGRGKVVYKQHFSHSPTSLRSTCLIAENWIVG